MRTRKIMGYRISDDHWGFPPFACDLLLPPWLERCITWRSCLRLYQSYKRPLLKRRSDDHLFQKWLHEKGWRHDCFRILSKTPPAMSQTKANTFFAIQTTSKKRQNSYLFSKNNRWPLLALHMANARNTIRQRFTHEILNFDTTQFSWISETRHSSRQSNYPVHST